MFLEFQLCKLRTASNPCLCAKIDQHEFIDQRGYNAGINFMLIFHNYFFPQRKFEKATVDSSISGACLFAN